MRSPLPTWVSFAPNVFHSFSPVVYPRPRNPYLMFVMHCLIHLPTYSFSMPYARFGGHSPVEHGNVLCPRCRSTDSPYSAYCCWLRPRREPCSIHGSSASRQFTWWYHDYWPTTALVFEATLAEPRTDVLWYWTEEERVSFCVLQKQQPFDHTITIFEIEKFHD